MIRSGPGWRGRLPALAVALLVLGAAAWTAAPGLCYACSCVMPPPPEQAMEESAAVFSGEVEAVRAPIRLFGGSSADPVDVTLRVKEIWKGDIEGDEVDVRTAESGASCGFAFEEGAEYLVYATGSLEDGLTVSLCSRTAPLAGAASDLEALGPGVRTADGDSGGATDEEADGGALDGMFGDAGNGGGEEAGGAGQNGAERRLPLSGFAPGGGEAAADEGDPAAGSGSDEGVRLLFGLAAAALIGLAAAFVRLRKIRMRRR